MAGEQERAKGTWDKAKGAVTGSVGKATDDEDLEAEGKLDKAKGSVEKAVGKTKGAVEDLEESVKDALS